MSGGLRCQVHDVVFRASGGRLLGRWAGGLPVVRLTTIGRRTGLRRSTMLAAPVVDGSLVVLVASNGGAPRDPDWLVNLRAHPEVEATVLGRQVRTRARIASPEEAAALWPRIIDRSPAYGRYRDRAAREIPLVCLDLPASS